MSFQQLGRVVVVRDLIGIDSGLSHPRTIDIPAGTVGTIHRGRWNPDTEAFEYLVEFNDQETGMQLIALATIGESDLREEEA